MGNIMSLFVHTLLDQITIDMNIIMNISLIYI